MSPEGFRPAATSDKGTTSTCKVPNKQSLQSRFMNGRVHGADAHAKCTALCPSSLPVQACGLPNLPPLIALRFTLCI